MKCPWNWPWLVGHVLLLRGGSLVDAHTTKSEMDLSLLLITSGIKGRLESSKASISL